MADTWRTTQTCLKSKEVMWPVTEAPSTHSAFKNNSSENGIKFAYRTEINLCYPLIYTTPCWPNELSPDSKALPEIEFFGDTSRTHCLFWEAWKCPILKLSDKQEEVKHLITKNIHRVPNVRGYPYFLLHNEKAQDHLLGNFSNCLPEIRFLGLKNINNTSGNEEFLSS